MFSELKGCLVITQAGFLSCSSNEPVKRADVEQSSAYHRLDAWLEHVVFDLCVRKLAVEHRTQSMM